MTFTADDIAPPSSEAQPALPEEEPPPPLPPKKSAAEAAQDFRELLAEKVVHAGACPSPLALRCVSWPFHTCHTRHTRALSGLALPSDLNVPAPIFLPNRSITLSVAILESRILSTKHKQQQCTLRLLTLMQRHSGFRGSCLGVHSWTWVVMVVAMLVACCNPFIICQLVKVIPILSVPRAAADKGV